jgi:hypothetical protein
VLSTEKGRKNAIEFLHANYSKAPKLVKRNKNSLSESVGRAGGIKAEDYYKLAQSLGIYAELLSHGSNESDKMNSFEEHAEGPPYMLFRQLFLTLVYASDCEMHNVDGVAQFGPRIYPKGDKKLLAL